MKFKILDPELLEKYEETAEWRAPKKGETCLMHEYPTEPGVVISKLDYVHNTIVLTPKANKKYDWGETIPRALVIKDGNVIKFSCVYHDDIERLSDEWIPHFGGECPFDAEACVVEVRFRTGDKRCFEASRFTWEGDYGSPEDIIAVRFVELKEGYTF